MATIAAAIVKDLRETTGVGMMDCERRWPKTMVTCGCGSTGCAGGGCRRPLKRPAAFAAEGLIGAITSGRPRHLSSRSTSGPTSSRDRAVPGTGEDGGRRVALSVGADVQVIEAAKVGSATVETAVTEHDRDHWQNMTLRRAASLEVSKGLVQLHPRCGHRWRRKMGVIVALESAGKADGSLHSAVRSRSCRVNENQLSYRSIEIDPAHRQAPRR